MVYFLEHTDTLDWEALLPLVSEARKKKALRYRNEADRYNSLAVYLLLRYGLFREHGIVEMPQLVPAPGGKPALSWSAPCFSLSHSGTAAVCALSTFPVGADLQKWSVCRPSVLRHAFSPAERQAVAAAANPDKAFTAIWSRKEAYGKALGIGLRYRLAETDFCQPCTLGTFQLSTWAIAEGALSLCAQEPLSLQPVTPEQLLELPR